jgi:signal transduction histidine kinase
MKILLIEDSIDHALLAQQALRLHNPAWDVQYVCTAEDGMKAIGDGHFDLVLLDYYLPGMSGLTFLKTIRERQISIPVIMITSLGHVKLAVECLRAGASDYVAKDEGYVDLLPATVDQVWRQYVAERENRDLQRQLKRKKEEAEASNRKLMEYQRRVIQAQKMNAIITLVRGICHELNNPLTGILGYAQLLGEVITGDGAEDIKEIEQCAQRCRDIIAKLAKFCRAEKSVHSQVDVNEALHESLAFVEYYANRNRVKTVAELQADLPALTGNVQDLRQAFLALFLNAIQAMGAPPRNGGTLFVKSYAEGELLYVVVQDTGEGIPPENLDKIFTPFFTTRDQGEGSGMGLAIAYGIMQDHEGSILVDSEVGKGSRFSLVFPIRKASPVTAGVAQ